MTRLFKYLICLTCLGFLYSCTVINTTTKNNGPAETYPGVKQMPPPAPPPPPMSSPVATSPAPSPVSTVSKEVYPVSGLSATKANDNIILVRNYLYTKDSGYEKPANFVLLPKRAVSEKEKSKHILICQLWKASFPSVEEVKGKIDDMQSVPFYWLLTKKVKSIDCKSLVENYDYTRSQLIMRNLKLETSKTFIIFHHQTGIVSMDLTKIHNDDDLELAMDTWKNKMTSMPKGKDSVSIYGLVYSAKAVLGALGELIAMK